jgi:aminoglycoside phosphotransferase (APT) family kinase protein
VTHVSEAVPTRDPVETAEALEEWLRGRLGAESVTVTGLEVPKAGFSNETIVADVAWTDALGKHDRPVVVRIEPTSHQLFVEPDALRQAQVMSTLAGRVPVPPIWLTDDDPDVLGAPFFLMERVDGRIPSDVPSWHAKGWTVALAVEDRRRLHDNALTELVRLHAVDTSGDEFSFLESDGDGSAIARYVDHVHTWYEWCEPVRRYDAAVIDAAMEYVLAEVPADARRSVVWGDARVGNIIFTDDLSVGAMLDWEGASLGPPEVDVTWWVMFDEFLCEAQGLTRLVGVPDRLGTFARYEELSGAPLRNVAYYEVLAGLQLSLINSRLADLLVSTGKAPESVGAEIVTRVTGLTRRALERAGRS